ncbi:MAG TPA: thiol reductant ABC exporter subunit CydC [Solirubrobacteraceae bacterium]|nr:thiol reductant ABC exporter subunit CydC [Solirubrobacteraceae bacterium]
MSAQAQGAAASDDRAGLRGGVRALAVLGRAGGGERRAFALAVLLGFGAVASSAALLATSGYLISKAAQRPPILSLLVVIVAVRTFALARALMRYGERLAAHDGALRMMARVRVRFFERLAPLVPGELLRASVDPDGRRREGTRAGELLGRFLSDVDALQELYARGIAPPLIAALATAGAALGAYLILPAAGPAVFAGMALASLLAPAGGMLLSTRAGRREAPARGALLAELLETLQGAPELALAGRSQERLAAISALDRALAGHLRRDGLAAGLAAALLSLIGGATILALVLIGVPALRSGALAPVMLAALIFLAIAAFEAVPPLADAGRRLGAGSASAQRLHELLRRRSTVRDRARPAPLPDQGELVMEDVFFRYSPADRWLLEGVSMQIEPGRLIALSGPSGAGKSTIAQLLVRFLDPQHGAVRIGGVDLREARQEQVRSMIVLIEQQAHLFNTSIRKNLLIARPSAGERELWEALEQVGIADFIAAQPQGLELMVGEGGEALSGGERRRIALARAFLSPARFLIFDEPTAHLDHASAQSVLDAIEAAAAERGVLLISHEQLAGERAQEALELRSGQILRATPDQYTALR